jgi:outer membrane lipoprotein SlyB
VVATGNSAFTINTSSSGSQTGDYLLTQPNIANAAATITPKALTATASIGGTLTKEYDGTTVASNANVIGTVTGGIAGDSISLDATSIRLNYDNAHVNNASTILASGTSAFKIDSSNSTSLTTDYQMPQPVIANVAGNITPKALTATATIGGALTKAYDGTTSTTATVTGTVAGAVANDTLTLDVSGVSLAYNNAHVANANAILATGTTTLNITASTAGSQASDYTFTAPNIPNASASITPATQ